MPSRLIARSGALSSFRRIWTYEHLHPLMALVLRRRPVGRTTAGEPGGRAADAADQGSGALGERHSARPRAKGGRARAQAQGAPGRLSGRGSRRGEGTDEGAGWAVTSLSVHRGQIAERAATRQRAARRGG